MDKFYASASFGQFSEQRFVPNVGGLLDDPSRLQDATHESNGIENETGHPSPTSRIDALQNLRADAFPLVLSSRFAVLGLLEQLVTEEKVVSMILDLIFIHIIRPLDERRRKASSVPLGVQSSESIIEDRSASSLNMRREMDERAKLTNEGDGQSQTLKCDGLSAEGLLMRNSSQAEVPMAAAEKVNFRAVVDAATSDDGGSSASHFSFFSSLPRPQAPLLTDAQMSALFGSFTALHEAHKHLMSHLSSKSAEIATETDKLLGGAAIISSTNANRSSVVENEHGPVEEDFSKLNSNESDAPRRSSKKTLPSSPQSTPNLTTNIRTISSIFNHSSVNYYLTQQASYASEVLKVVAPAHFLCHLVGGGGLKHNTNGEVINWEKINTADDEDDDGPVIDGRNNKNASSVQQNVGSGVSNGGDVDVRVAKLSRSFVSSNTQIATALAIRLRSTSKPSTVANHTNKDSATSSSSGGKNKKEKRGGGGGSSAPSYSTPSSSLLSNSVASADFNALLMRSERLSTVQLSEWIPFLRYAMDNVRCELELSVGNESLATTKQQVGGEDQQQQQQQQQSPFGDLSASSVAESPLVSHLLPPTLPSRRVLDQFREELQRQHQEEQKQAAAAQSNPTAAVPKNRDIEVSVPILPTPNSPQIRAAAACATLTSPELSKDLPQALRSSALTTTTTMVSNSSTELNSASAPLMATTAFPLPPSSSNAFAVAQSNLSYYSSPYAYMYGGTSLAGGGGGSSKNPMQLPRKLTPAEQRIEDVVRRMQSISIDEGAQRLLCLMAVPLASSNRLLSLARCLREIQWEDLWLDVSLKLESDRDLLPSTATNLLRMHEQEGDEEEEAENEKKKLLSNNESDSSFSLSSPQKPHHRLSRLKKARSIGDLRTLRKSKSNVGDKSVPPLGAEQHEDDEATAHRAAATAQRMVAAHLGFTVLDEDGEEEKKEEATGVHSYDPAVASAATAVSELDDFAARWTQNAEDARRLGLTQSSSTACSATLLCLDQPLAMTEKQIKGGLSYAHIQQNDPSLLVSQQQQGTGGDDATMEGVPSPNFLAASLGGKRRDHSSTEDGNANSPFRTFVAAIGRTLSGAFHNSAAAHDSTTASSSSPLDLSNSSRSSAVEATPTPTARGVGGGQMDSSHSPQLVTASISSNANTTTATSAKKSIDNSNAAAGSVSLGNSMSGGEAHLCPRTLLHCGRLQKRFGNLYNRSHERFMVLFNDVLFYVAEEPDRRTMAMAEATIVRHEQRRRRHAKAVAQIAKEQQRIETIRKRREQQQLLKQKQQNPKGDAVGGGGGPTGTSTTTSSSLKPNVTDLSTGLLQNEQESIHGNMNRATSDSFLKGSTTTMSRQQQQPNNYNKRRSTNEDAGEENVRENTPESSSLNASLKESDFDKKKKTTKQRKGDPYAATNSASAGEGEQKVVDTATKREGKGSSGLGFFAGCCATDGTDETADSRQARRLLRGKEIEESSTAKAPTRRLRNVCGVGGAKSLKHDEGINITDTNHENDTKKEETPSPSSASSPFSAAPPPMPILFATSPERHEVGGGERDGESIQLIPKKGKKQQSGDSRQPSEGGRGGPVVDTSAFDRSRGVVSSDEDEGRDAVDTLIASRPAKARAGGTEEQKLNKKNPNKNKSKSRGGKRDDGFCELVDHVSGGDGNHGVDASSSLSTPRDSSSSSSSSSSRFSEPNNLGSNNNIAGHNSHDAEDVDDRHEGDGGLGFDPPLNDGARPEDEVAPSYFDYQHEEMVSIATAARRVPSFARRRQGKGAGKNQQQQHVGNSDYAHSPDPSSAAKHRGSDSNNNENIADGFVRDLSLATGDRDLVGRRPSLFMNGGGTRCPTTASAQHFRVGGVASRATNANVALGVRSTAAATSLSPHHLPTADLPRAAAGGGKGGAAAGQPPSSVAAAAAAALSTAAAEKTSSNGVVSNRSAMRYELSAVFPLRLKPIMQVFDLEIDDINHVSSTSGKGRFGFFFSFASPTMSAKKIVQSALEAYCKDESLRQCCFILIVPSRSYVFLTPTRDEKVRWVFAIRKAIADTNKEGPYPGPLSSPYEPWVHNYLSTATSTSTSISGAAQKDKGFVLISATKNQKLYVQGRGSGSAYDEGRASGGDRRLLISSSSSSRRGIVLLDVKEEMISSTTPLSSAVRRTRSPSHSKSSGGSTGRFSSARRFILPKHSFAHCGGDEDDEDEISTHDIDDDFDSLIPSEAAASHMFSPRALRATVSFPEANAKQKDNKSKKKKTTFSVFYEKLTIGQAKEVENLRNAMAAARTFAALTFSSPSSPLPFSQDVQASKMDLSGGGTARADFSTHTTPQPSAYAFSAAAAMLRPAATNFLAGEGEKQQRQRQQREDSSHNTNNTTITTTNKNRMCLRPLSRLTQQRLMDVYLHQHPLSTYSCDLGGRIAARGEMQVCFDGDTTNMVSTSTAADDRQQRQEQATSPFAKVKHNVNAIITTDAPKGIVKSPPVSSPLCSSVAAPMASPLTRGTVRFELTDTGKETQDEGSHEHEQKEKVTPKGVSSDEPPTYLDDTLNGCQQADKHAAAEEMKEKGTAPQVSFPLVSILTDDNKNVSGVGAQQTGEGESEAALHGASNEVYSPLLTVPSAGQQAVMPSSSASATSVTQQVAVRQNPNRSSLRWSTHFRRSMAGMGVSTSSGGGGGASSSVFGIPSATGGGEGLPIDLGDAVDREEAELAAALAAAIRVADEERAAEEEKNRKTAEGGGGRKRSPPSSRKRENNGDGDEAESSDDDEGNYRDADASGTTMHRDPNAVAKSSATESIVPSRSHVKAASSASSRPPLPLPLPPPPAQNIEHLSLVGTKYSDVCDDRTAIVHSSESSSSYSPSSSSDNDDPDGDANISVHDDDTRRIKVLQTLLPKATAKIGKEKERKRPEGDEEGKDEAHESSDSVPLKTSATNAKKDSIEDVPLGTILDATEGSSVIATRKRQGSLARTPNQNILSAVFGSSVGSSTPSKKSGGKSYQALQDE